MIGEGDKLAVVYSITATHKGTLMGSPATGKQLRLTGTFIYTFKNRKEVEALPFPDNLSLFQQLGIKPPG